MNIRHVPVTYQDDRGTISDVLKNEVVEYATIITSRKGSVRGNHYHEKTFQYLYVIEGTLRVVTQMPGEEARSAVLHRGDVILNAPLERHAFEALEDSTCLVLTRGPRGGDNYEGDTFRLDEPLIPGASGQK